MKARIKEVKLKPPPKRVVLTLTEEEASVVMAMAMSVNWYEDNGDQRPGGEVARDLWNALDSAGVEEKRLAFRGRLRSEE